MDKLIVKTDHLQPDETQSKTIESYIVSGLGTEVKGQCLQLKYAIKRLQDELLADIWIAGN